MFERKRVMILWRSHEMTHGNATGKQLGQVAETCAFAVRSAPEALLLLACIAMSAVWATRSGTLAGEGFPVLGAAIQGILWACLYAGLGLAYCAVARKQRDSARSVWRKLGLCLPLALISTHISKLLLAPLLVPAMWADFFYLRRFLAPAFIGLWCTVLMPRETRALYRAAKTNPTITPLPELTVLLASAVVLVSCADLAFQWRWVTAVEDGLRVDIIRTNAWATNVLILFSAYALVFAVTSRVATGLLVVSPLYATLGLATLAKIKYMHSAVQPFDLIRVPEFLPLFRSFFGTGGLVATVSALGIWIGALVAVRRIEPCRMSAVRCWSIGLLSIAVLLAVPVIFPVANSLPSANVLLRPFGVPNALLLRFGAPDSQHQEKARRNGFLLSFLSQVPAAFVSTPPNYSPAAVASTLSKYWRPDIIGPEGSRGGRVNLIVYLVESFMDPDGLGLHYTSDPIPNFRALHKTHISGHGIVPERFGGSANTEFEVLTGMTMSFLPEGSLPYRQYLRHPIPSLPRALSSLGYATIAIQADPKYYFDRERVYDLLGFDKVVWLNADEVPDVERAARGRWTSDMAIVEAVIQASQGARPFFAFAFPSSTHSPYNVGTYRESDLDVLDLPSSDKVGEVKEYINALRVADRAIGTLIQYFRGQPDPTIIAIFGDHLPPLSEHALQTFSRNLSGMSKAEQARMTHRVPLLVWANFDLPREEKELSINALPSYLLEKMQIPPPGFLVVTDAVRLKVPVLASYVQGADGNMWDRDSLPGEERAVVEDYRLLQYDLLLGKQYSLRDSVSGWKPSNGASSASH
jgi:phosphoglycerol transferase MdoB-like AlkP superfamily enzyme